MINLIKAEFAKLFSTKLWLWLLLGAVAFTIFVVSITIGFDGQSNNNGGAPRLNTPDGQRNLFSSAGAANVWALILGAIAVTGEFRHQTVTPTFLATPHRGRVVLAKLITYLIVGIGYGVATIVAAIAVALPWVSAKDIDISLGSNGIPGVLVGVAASVAVYALVGVGLGALIRNQIATVVGALVFLFVLEPILSAVPKVRDYFKWLPGGASSALTHRFIGPDVKLLTDYQGGLLLVTYGLVFAILGSWLAMRRDVT